MHRSDRELLSAFDTNDDEAAFQILVERYWALVLTASRRSGASDPEDVAQAAFLLLANQAGRLASRSEIAGFLYESARRISLQQRRTNLARKQREHSAAAAVAVRQPDSDLSDLILTALDRLKVSDKSVILLKHVHGLTEKDIGQRMGLTGKAVSVRLSRARARLRRLLTSPAFSGASLLFLASSVEITPLAAAAISHRALECKGGAASDVVSHLVDQPALPSVARIPMGPLLVGLAVVLGIAMIIAWGSFPHSPIAMASDVPLTSSSPSSDTRSQHSVEEAQLRHEQLSHEQLSHEQLSYDTLMTTTTDQTTSMNFLDPLPNHITYFRKSDIPFDEEKHHFIKTIVRLDGVNPSELEASHPILQYLIDMAGGGWTSPVGSHGNWDHDPGPISPERVWTEEIWIVPKDRLQLESSG